MIIKLTKEQHQMIDDCESLELNGEEFEYMEEHEDMNENGVNKIMIWKRPSDNKFFQSLVYYCRYGYEDYGYESSCQDLNLYEVEKKEIITYKWVNIKD